MKTFNCSMIVVQTGVANIPRLMVQCFPQTCLARVPHLNHFPEVEEANGRLRAFQVKEA